MDLLISLVEARIPAPDSAKARIELSDSGLIRRGVNDYDTTSLPTHRESTVSTETINPKHPGG